MAKRIQCSCGTYLDDPKQYNLLFLKKELNEIDILCPNQSCFLRELGYVKFHRSSGKAVFDEASFYPPFVTWNAAQDTSGETDAILKNHLKEIVTNLINWKRVDLEFDNGENRSHASTEESR